MLKKISINNFRNHSSQDINFEKSGLIIIGKNGAGKTSILESIFISSNTKSFRSKDLYECTKYNENYSIIDCFFENDKYTTKWQIKPKKIIFEKNKINLKQQEFIKEKNIFSVIFSPEDLQLPFASPQERRNFLNRVLLITDSDLFIIFQRYQRVLQQRNALLKNIKNGLSQKTMIDFFDNELISNSLIITNKRMLFFKEVESEINNFYKFISSSNQNLSIKFIPNSYENIEEKLKSRIELDIIRGYTSVGSHRDDFVFTLDEKQINNFGSRGEIRSAILALKMAERWFIEKTKKIKPILLLDDVFSELDEKRKSALVEFTQEYQKIITTTDLENVTINKDLAILKL